MTIETGASHASYHAVMETVTMRDLRNRGRELVDRVAAGEVFLITRSGRPVAELVPVRRPGLRAEELLRRWQSLPLIDATSFRNDVDAALDAAL